MCWHWEVGQKHSVLYVWAHTENNSYGCFDVHSTGVLSFTVSHEWFMMFETFQDWYIITWCYVSQSDFQLTSKFDDDDNDVH